MRRLAGVAVVMVAIVASVSSTAGAAIKPVVLTGDQLAAAMLSSNDMPAAWTGIARGALSLTPSATAGACNGPNADARAQTAGVVSFAGSVYWKDPDYGPAVSEVGYAFPTVKAAHAFVAASRKALSSCTTTWESAGASGSNTTLHWTIMRASFGKVGDETFGFRQVAARVGASTSKIVFDTVYVRRVNTVLVVTRNGAVDVIGTVETDAPLVSSLAKKAVKKLDSSLKAASR